MHQDNIESLWRKVTNTSADNCPMEFAKALVTSAVLSERERWQDVVYDGWKVFGGLDDQAVKRTSHQNVSDVLDALLRVLRSNAVMTGPQAPSP